MNIVWTGAADSNWRNAANWTPQQIPGPGDTVTLAPGSYSVNTGSYWTAIADQLGVGAGVTVSVSDIGQLQLGGTVDNAGVIVANQGDSAALLVGTSDNAAVTLQGGGTIMLGQAGTLAAGVSGASLDNIDNTIEGSGAIQGGFALSNGAGGLIQAVAGGYGSRLDIYGAQLANAGTLRATAGATAWLDYGARVTQSAGGVIAASGSGASVELAGATVIGGTLDASGGGTIYTSRSSNNLPLLDGAVAGGLTILGGFVVQDTAVVSLEGAIHNQGSVTANGGDWAQILIGGPDAASVTLDGGGTVMLGQSGTVQSGITGASLDNVDNTIEGSGAIQGGFALTNAKAGLIEAVAGPYGSRLNFDTAQVANAGTLLASAGATLWFDGGTALTQSAGGVIAAMGSGAVVDLVGATVTGGTLDAGGGGTIYTSRSSNNRPLLDGVVAGGLTILGRFVVQDAAVVSLEGAIHNTGSITADGGDWAQILIGAGANAAVTLDGAGTVTLGQLGTVAAGVGGATLVNVNNTIDGSGTIAGGLTLNNDHAGLIDANSGGRAIDVYGAAVFNAGTMLAGGGVLNFNEHASVLNTGTLGAGPGGVANLSVPITNNGVLLANDGVVTENGGLSGSGIIDITGDGRVTLNTAVSMNTGFTGAGVLDLPTTYTGTISGFAADDAIALPNVPWQPGNPNWLTPPDLGARYGSYWGNSAGLADNFVSVQYTPNAAGTGGVLTVDEHALYSWIDHDNDNNYVGSAYTVFPIWSVAMSGSYAGGGFGITNLNDGSGGIGFGGGAAASFVWAMPVSGAWTAAANWKQAKSAPPTTGANVTLGLSGAYTVSDGQPVTVVSQLAVTDAAATLSVAAGTSFSADGGSVAGAVQVQAGGTFAVDGKLTLTGKGSLAALGAGSLIALTGAYVSGGAIAVGSGATLAASAAASTIGGGATIADAGLLLASAGGTLLLGNVAVNATGGTLAAAGPGAAVVLSGVSLTNAGFAAEGGSFVTAAFSDSTLNGGTLQAGGLLSVVDASTLTLLGGIAILGTLQVAGTADATGLAIMGAVTLGGGGSVTLGDSAANQILGGAPGATLANADQLTGAGRIGDGDGTLGLTNKAAGLIEATGANPLTIGTGVAVVNAGTLAAAAGSTLTVADALTSTGTLLAGGSIALSGATDTLAGSIAGAGTLTAGGAVAITAGLTDTAALTRFLGGVNVTATVTETGGTLYVGGAAAGTGHYRIGGGATLAFAGPATAGGVAFLPTGGTLAFMAGSSVNAPISGFAAGDTIDIGGLPVADIVAKSFAANTLTVSVAGGGSETMHFAGAYTLADFAVQTDASGMGTAVVFK